MRLEHSHENTFLNENFCAIHFADMNDKPYENNAGEINIMLQGQGCLN